MGPEKRMDYSLREDILLDNDKLVSRSFNPLLKIIYAYRREADRVEESLEIPESSCQRFMVPSPVLNSFDIGRTLYHLLHPLKSLKFSFQHLDEIFYFGDAP